MLRITFINSQPSCLNCLLLVVSMTIKFLKTIFEETIIIL